MTTVRSRPDPMRLEAALSGILAMLVAEREESPRDSKSRKTEVLLAAAGLTNDEIAAVTGKSADAVRKTVERDRKST